MKKLTTDELTALFPEGIPLAVAKLIFPEKSEPMTVDEIRFFLNAVSKPTVYAYRIEIGGDKQGNRWGTDTWVAFKAFHVGTTLEQVRDVFKSTVNGYRPELHQFFRLTHRQVTNWEVVE